jgi:hypothetical protein
MYGFKKIIALSILILALSVSGVIAQVSPDKGVYFELSPHTGFMDGSGVFGLDASMNYKSLNLEFSGSQVIGETADMFPLTLNLVINFAQSGKMIPFGLVGAGLLLTVPTTTIGNKTVSTLGLNFGGGLRFYVSDSFGLRLGVTQYLTNIESKRDATDELLTFQEVTIGVVFVFK